MQAFTAQLASIASAKKHKAGAGAGAGDPGGSSDGLEVQGPSTETRANRTRGRAVMTSKYFDKARTTGQRLALFGQKQALPVQAVMKIRV